MDNVNKCQDLYNPGMDNVNKCQDLYNPGMKLSKIEVLSPNIPYIALKRARHRKILLPIHKSHYLNKKETSGRIK